MAVSRVSRTSPPARRPPRVSTDRPEPAAPESASELAHRVAILEEEARGLRLQNEALRTDLSQANDELEWRRALADDGGATYSYEQETEVFEAERERDEAEAVAEVAEEELRAVRARGLQLGGDLLKRTEELADLRAAKSRLEEELRKADVRYKVLEARAFDTEALLAAAKERAAEWEAKGKKWRAERAQLQRDLTEATRNVGKRRDELYFTRVQLMKEQLRLRSELEHSVPALHPTPAPSPPQAARHEASPRRSRRENRTLAEMSPRRSRAAKRPASASPQARPSGAIPPATFVHELAPRSPRSTDPPLAFANELLVEWRVATGQEAGL